MNEVGSRECNWFICFPQCYSVVEVELETTIVHRVYRGLYRDNAKWNGVCGLPSEHGLILIFAVYRVGFTVCGLG